MEGFLFWLWNINRTSVWQLTKNRRIIMVRLEAIPEYVKKSLAERNVWPASIKLTAGADLSIDGDFCETWIVITDESLVLIRGPVTSSVSFTGTGEKSRTKARESKSWRVDAFETYPLEEVEGLKVENLASSCILILKTKNGEKALCCFTNSHSRKFRLMAKLLDKVKKGEELVDEDFVDDRPLSYCPKCGMLYPDQARPVCPRCLDKRSIFLRVLSFVPRYKVQTTLIILFMLLSSALNLLSPYLGGQVLFDEVLAEGGKYYGRVFEIILVIILARLLSLLISITYARINAGMTAEVIYDLKTEIFSAMQRLSLSFYSRKQTGSLMTRVNSDAMHLQYFFHDGLPYFIVNCVNIIGIGTVMVIMNWKLALMVLIPAPLIVLFLRKSWPKLYALFGRRYRKSSSMNSLLNDTFKGFRVVKAFGKEMREIERFGRANEGVYSVDIGLGNMIHTMFPLVSLGMTLGGIIVWAAGGTQVISGSLSFGTLMTFANYIGMIYGPLEFMTHIVDWWNSCMNSAQRIFEVLDAVPEVTEKPDPVRLPDMKGEIELKNVTFSYEPNKPVLQDINIKIKAGEVIGLVGHSGAGKSTIANLITRLYDVQEGSISIDGINVKDLAIKDLRKQIGMVSQETYLFIGTIAENISYAKPDATMEEIISAAKAANAHEFIMKLPDGYDTRIGTGGRDLSGGERQRISIARAILHDPKILILDEATASVDTDTERQIQEALEKLVKGRTTISIAHRLSTLRNADRLYVLENGKIVEEGTHAELIRARGVYYKLYTKQSEALKMRGVGD